MKTLGDIPAAKAGVAAQAAEMRLQLFAVMRTHELLREVLDDCRDVLERAGLGAEREPGQWDGLAGALAVEGVARVWTQRWAEWRTLFENLRAAAVAIPLGVLAVLHAWAFDEVGTVGEAVKSVNLTDLGRAVRPLAEAGPAVDLEQVVFKPQLRAILDAAAGRVWDDGFKLSQRIWRLEQESLDGIRQTVYRGLAEGQSAWQMAKQLEQFLGAGGGCPRWARSRLYDLTKKDIASGDRTGLYSGSANDGGECDGQGVAYKALRLARNEIQIAHHLATDALLDRLPWIEQEQVHLSPAHPEPDVCDDLAGGGENGDGIYPKGSVLLPAHVQCLCYKTAVLPSSAEFAGRLKGWLDGSASWPEMDAYAGWLGVGGQDLASVSLAVTLAQQLVVWLWGDQAAMDAAAAENVLAGGQLALPNI